ncbi:MAG: 23S rRNA (pseudouridine(1915)-N(3))-methyltransferase RlmH, partial [Clostridia bacterium]|nr:23S rRNA (pseudouridine(1915)-N(3))-methyltransferase RlmH [Clostridia bacterium]
MIKIRIVCVGKVKESYFEQGIKEYEKRLSRFCDFSIVEVKEENYSDPDRSQIAKIMDTEGERIDKAIKGYPICLAIEGKHLSSEEFADKIRGLSD